MAERAVAVENVTCLVCRAARDAEAIDPDTSRALQVLAPPGTRIVHQKFLDCLTQEIHGLYEERGKLKRRIEELEP